MHPQSALIDFTNFILYLLRKAVLILALLLVGCTVTLVAYYFCTNTEKKALTDTERRHTSGKYIQLKNGITHYQLGGPAKGDIVVLISGFSTPYFLCDSTYNYLVRQGFRVLRYDSFGRGYSDRPDVNYTTDLYVQQFSELLRNLHLKQPVDVVGLSFGGRIAVDAVGLHPKLIKKVVLLDLGYGSMRPKYYPEFYTWYKTATHLPQIAAAQAADFKYPQQHPDWAEHCINQMQYKGYSHALVSTMYHYNFDTPASLSRLNRQHKPVLLIWGKDDVSTPYRLSDSVRQYLKAEFFPVKDAAHLPATEQSALVNKKIADFLKS